MKEDIVMEYARIVEIAWVIGPSDRSRPPDINKSRLVCPDGFQISSKATDKCHKITNEMALRDGVPLAVALCDFMRDVTDAFARGGKLVSHHIEFDAGIISHELRRCGFESLQTAWDKVAGKGVCTMHPEIGEWVQRCANTERDNHVLSLDTLASMTLHADHVALKAPRHRAGPDAMLTYLIYVAMLSALD